MKDNTKIENENLKKLIIICTYNIKGLTKREEIEETLPIKTKEISIYKKENRLVFEKSNGNTKEVWTDTNCYSNLEILKNITPIYGVEYSGDEIIELMKYRNKIILVLL